MNCLYELLGNYSLFSLAISVLWTPGIIVYFYGFLPKSSCSVPRIHVNWTTSWDGICFCFSAPSKGMVNTRICIHEYFVLRAFPENQVHVFAAAV